MHNRRVITVPGTAVYTEVSRLPNHADCCFFVPRKPDSPKYFGNTCERKSSEISGDVTQISWVSFYLISTLHDTVTCNHCGPKKLGTTFRPPDVRELERPGGLSHARAALMFR